MEQISDTTSNKREFEASRTFSWQLERKREKKRKRKRREGEREKRGEGGRGEGEEGRGKKVEKGKVEYIPSNLIQDCH